MEIQAETAARKSPIKDARLHVALNEINQSLSLVAAWCIRFSQEPADQSVVLGERVVLSCVVFNYSGIVQWTKDGLALGIGEGLRGKHRQKKPSAAGEVYYKKITCVSPRCRHQCEVERGIKSATVLVQF